MIELYKKINDRKINKTVNKLMKHPPKDDWKYFRIGVEMCGGDIQYAKEIIIRELEFMNTTPYEELLTYHPKKFTESIKGTNWAKSGLKFYPGATHEYIYIGKCLSDYKNQNGQLDMEKVNTDFQLIQLDISSFNKDLCKKEMKEKEGVEPNLEKRYELLPFFPNAEEVYVCDKTKTIAVFFEFRVMLYEPKAVGMRLDSWRYNPKYYIKDEKVLNHQLEKIKQLSEKLNIPGKEDPAGFIYWTNADVTKDEIQEYLFLSNSIGCKSLQYYKECKAELLNSEYGEKFRDYKIRNVTTTFDPFTGNREGRAKDYKLVSDDFSKNQTYKELYE